MKEHTLLMVVAGLGVLSALVSASVREGQPHPIPSVAPMPIAGAGPKIESIQRTVQQFSVALSESNSASDPGPLTTRRPINSDGLFLDRRTLQLTTRADNLSERHPNGIGSLFKTRANTTISNGRKSLAQSRPPDPRILGGAVSRESSAQNLEHAPGRVGPTEKIEFYMSDKGQPATLTYQEIDGLAVFEGDIILGRSADLQMSRPRTSAPRCVGDVCSSVQKLSVRFGETYLWPGGVIPFEVDPRFNAQGRAEIAAGISMLNAATNLLVQPRTGERDYIAFVPSNGCSSWVGRQTGRQNVNVMDPGCGAGGVAHEILHAAGIWHEQSRSDRDRFIRILWGNILPGLEHNFEMHASDGVNVGPYDMQSIMHYGATAFGKKDPATGQTLRTIETIPPGGNVGNANRMSSNDIAGVNQLYPISRTERYVPIQNLVLGLRHSQNQANDYVVPLVKFGQVVARRIHGGDRGAPSGEGFNWWMIPTETPLSSLRMEEIPPGVVLGLWHSQNMNNIPADFRLISVRGGDLGAPSGEGFVWYETRMPDRVNWDVVDMLPPYTVLGLKHSQNQRDKTFLWRDGRTYDPLATCPDGFDRKNGGDRGAPSGTGFYWCEKRRP